MHGIRRLFGHQHEALVFRSLLCAMINHAPFSG
jgi:hypothetical protein